MARRTNSKNKEAKNNGLGASVAKIGGTLGSCEVGLRESSPAESTNGWPKTRAEGQDCLHQQIAELAYVLYERSGFQDGKDLEHWLEAERQVKGVRGQAA